MHILSENGASSEKKACDIRDIDEIIRIFEKIHSTDMLKYLKEF